MTMVSNEVIADIKRDLSLEKLKVGKNPEHVVILGSGDGYKQCPPTGEIIWDRKRINAEVWGINGLLYDQFPLDKLFMMDVLDEMPSIISGRWDLKKTIDHINKLDIPVVGPFKYDEIPKSEAFPMDEVVQKFGVPYFNNTIAYMVAYAILKGVKSISTWGINQASGSEYFYEKGCVEYWLGQALGRGIHVFVNGPSELLTNKARYGGSLLYGYNTNYEGLSKYKARFGDRVIHKLLDPKVYNVPLQPGKYDEQAVAHHASFRHYMFTHDPAGKPMTDGGELQK